MAQRDVGVGVGVGGGVVSLVAHTQPYSVLLQKLDS